MRNYISRRQNIEEKKQKKKAFIMLFLTIVFIIVFFKFGIPLLVRYINFLSGFSRSSTGIEITDTTPPPPPIVNYFPEYTNSKEVEITGSTEAGATLVINVNDEVNEVIADNSGNFIYKVTLDDGKNYIDIISKDTSGNESSKLNAGTIVFDNTPPEISIEKPADNSQFYGSKERQITIEGKTEPDSKVIISGRHAIVSSEGQFSLTYSLSEGENKLNVTSEDLAGNKSEKNITVNYSN